MPNELINPNNVVTEERLAQFYQQILPYLGGMPDVLANKFNRSDLYSTDEKLIGRWIDGKPIWQKIDNICNLFGLAKGDSEWRYLPYSSGDLTYVISLDVQGSDIRIITKRNYSDMSAYVTIQYTKTTDPAVEIGDDTDYSTTEKIVGTWIDGKPVYQKTCTYNNKKLYGSDDYTTLDIGESFALVISGKLTLESSDEYNGTCIIPECRPTPGTTGIRVYKTGTWNASADRTWQFTVQYTKTSS